MIVRNHRFRGRNSVLRALKRGRVIRGAYFSLKLADKPADKPWRAAVVVSKKVHKSAVVRNRIRRRLYEQLRLRGETTPFESDIIIIVYSERVAIMPTSDLVEALENLIQQDHHEPKA